MEHSEYREEIPHGDHPVSYDHSEPHYRLIAALMAITVVLLLFTGIAIQVYYDQLYAADEQERVLAPENWNLRDLRSKEQAELTRYGYVDKDKGIVRIPIDQAMQQVARDAAENKLQYPTNPYPVKTEAQLAGAGGPGVSQPGAAAANAAQDHGTTSSPNVQKPEPEHK